MTTDNYQDVIEEYDILMQAGLECAEIGESESAESYFSDAVYVIKDIEDIELKAKLLDKYEINPMDFAQ